MLHVVGFAKVRWLVVACVAARSLRQERLLFLSFAFPLPCQIIFEAHGTHDADDGLVLAHAEDILVLVCRVFLLAHNAEDVLVITHDTDDVLILTHNTNDVLALAYDHGEDVLVLPMTRRGPCPHP